MCAFVGPAVTALCILPCLGTALIDSTVRVVAESLSCLQKLVGLRLLSAQLVAEAVKDTGNDLLYRVWVQEGC